MSERVITHIDLLIHPDYHLVDTNRPQHRGYPSMTNVWDTRIRELSKRANTILLYFPVIPVNPKGIYNPVPSFLDGNHNERELDRQKRYKDYLQDRLFIFSPWEEPKQEQINTLFQKKGFKYNRTNISICSFGEYLELCVMTWRMNICAELGIPELHSWDIPLLSFADTKSTFTMRKYTQKSLSV